MAIIANSVYTRAMERAKREAEADYEAFDALPRPIRRRLTEACVLFPSQEVLFLYKSLMALQGSDGAIRAVLRRIDVLDAFHRHKQDKVNLSAPNRVDKPKGGG